MSKPKFHLAPLAAFVGAALCTFCTIPSATAEDLGMIQVESSTITDRFENKREEPSNIGAISGETVDSSHVENIQQLLRRIPGVTTEVQSDDSLKIHLRGVENQVYMGEKPGVAVVIDGVPVFERTGRVNIDLDNIQSIKVVKGGASYLYGDDALAGAVIITTKRGAQQAGVKLGAEAGSYGYYKGLGRIGYASENSAGHVQVSSRQKEGYYDDSASRADYADGKWQYYLDNTSDLTFGFSLSKRKKNSHGSVKGVTAAHEDPKSEDPSYNDYANHFDVDLSKFFVTYSKDLGRSNNLMVNAYQFSDNTEFDENPTDADPNKYSVAVDYKQVQRGVKSEYRAGGERVAWMAGVDLRSNYYDNGGHYLDCSDYSWDPSCAVGATFEDNRTDEKVRAGYGELKYKATDRLVLTVNGRTDHIDLDYNDDMDSSDNGSKTFDVWSWRLGGNYAVRSNLDFYANLSTGFRAPTVDQLFVGTSSPTMRTDPNPDLKPEYSLNQEIGIRTKTTFLGMATDIDLALFQLDRKDHIQSTAGQYTTTSGNIYDNVGDIRNRGLELSVLGDVNRQWSWDLAYTYINAKYTKYDQFVLSTAPIGGACPAGKTPVIEMKYNPILHAMAPTVTSCAENFDNAGNAVPRVPKHHVNFLLRYRPDDYWTISGEMDAKSSYYADEINRVKIGGVTLYNLLVNYDRKIGGNQWSFFGRIDNVFDRYYYNTARGSGDGNDDGVYNDEDISIVVNEGRVYTAGVSVAF
jgi:iron complex outermembrane receptor protein